ncbi:helix-turn-helix domain-containing protein [Brevibacillus nitrificans]|uniref:helix-turn-helix domain-containing protein n=1 Tax=Brevibacillus nitrificans TaxID=651560 RepID=UPI002609E4CB|nr:helix-turn-helix domain-containing protein [Brevibacillus nitrificans]MED1795752.1 helix-turn-helix domain-containing protein [Brevibacillus nitrificans]
MGIDKKNSVLIERLNTHLRKIARQLIQFDTLDETLSFLLDSFWKQFSCDYVSIILFEGDCLKNIVSKGDADHFEGIFPINRTSFSSRFLESPVWCYDIIKQDERCLFYDSIDAEKFATWFTVPIKEQDTESYGVCLIGFRSYVTLFEEANKLFVEFGKDIVSAIGLAMNKEKEKKKMEGMEWLKENAYLGSSLEKLVGSTVNRAGKGTGAESACVYLYDEGQRCFALFPAIYGHVNLPDRIQVDSTYNLHEYFPFLERFGDKEITIPLVVNLKTVGVLHVSNKQSGAFTRQDSELLYLIASHVSVLIENARLYQNELESKTRLETFMEHQKELVKQTLTGEGFTEITGLLAQMIQRTVMLFDRFIRQIVSSTVGMTEEDVQEIDQFVAGKKKEIGASSSLEQWLPLPNGRDIYLLSIRGGGDLLGVLGIVIDRHEVDAVLNMTLKHAINVYATQFIKQKLVLDAKEQVKDSFLYQLFDEDIQNKEQVIQYANLFKLDVYEPHKIALFTIAFDENRSKESDLLNREAKKTMMWEYIREDLSQYHSGIVVTRKEGLFVLLVPDYKSKEGNQYWERLHRRLNKIISRYEVASRIYMGISTSTNKMEDFSVCYKQALQALKIVQGRLQSKGLIDFESLGSYIVLSNLQDPTVAELFIDNYLGALLKYSKGKDLFDTLRVYLTSNGNLKDTSEQLFIHRSSLKYRLDRIHELLKLDIEDAEERFNLMLAYKLYDFYHT